MGPLILIAALLAGEATVDAPQFQVDTIDGRSAVGTLERLNDSELDLKASDGQRTFKLSEVQFVASAETPVRFQPLASAVGPKSKQAALAVILETLDGTRLAGSEFQVGKGTAKLKLLSGESLNVPTKSIHRVEFPLDGKIAPWPELPKDPAADLIIVRKKDASDLVEGIAGDVTAETVQFTVDGDVIPVKRWRRTMGIVYFHPQRLANAAEPAAIIETKSGSKVGTAEVALVDGQIRLTTTFGSTLAWPLDAVRSIDFSPSRMVYLSDLPPDLPEWTAWLELGGFDSAVASFYKPRFDCSRDGGPLSIAGKTYRKGVALIPRTVLEYKIAGRGHEFRATVGIDDAVHGAGRMQLIVEGDGQNLYSGKITGRDKPVDLKLNVANVKRLRIIADFGGEADVGDYLDLGDARIVK